jgi:hypothetical protein
MTEATSVEQIVEAFVDHYELSDAGGAHSPTDYERFLIKDAVMGLLSDDDFARAYRGEGCVPGGGACMLRQR